MVLKKMNPPKKSTTAAKAVKAAVAGAAIAGAGASAAATANAKKSTDTQLAAVVSSTKKTDYMIFLYIFIAVIAFGFIYGFFEYRSASKGFLGSII
jgi:hypothetical protein